jgi:N-acetylated-alpha-linked acidic dipeptidase
LRRLGLTVVVFLSFILLIAAKSGDEPRILDGYSAVSSQTERSWEEKFRAIPNPANLRDYMQHLSARPHHVGSPYDKQNAEWIRAKFQDFGFDAKIETFYVLFPTPKERVVELVAPTKFVAKLQEPPVPQDPTSNQQAEQLPTYNAYSADGDVTAPLVYVNYGMRDDYEELDRRGISVKGAIVIARYGGGWRGIKPKVAAEHGAVGCLIYSDPADDGYAEGEVFPQGAYRPKDGVQRGSVADTQYPGDPLTPGIGATKDAKRLDVKDAQTIQKIPVLPISYGDAQPLLAAMQGSIAPEKWRGALPITYRIGPGPAKVHLKVQSNWDIKEIYDVIAKIPGSTNPDEWVLRGNHHDAWVNGADDPLSGMVAELEEARGFGALLKQGWKPKRTIIYCAWDGEEPGLLGSTEWVETHNDELQQHAVMYINSDNTGRGYLRASGSHTLEKFINAVAREVQDPEKTNITLWKRANLLRIARATSGDDRQELRQRNDLRITALGDGSDYAPFLDHAGIAALDLRFGGEDGGGVYHSIYDDFYWYTHFSDKNFVYGRALAQTAGTAIMRMADADLLPFDFMDSSDTVRRYVQELQKLVRDKQTDMREKNREIDEGVFTATSDPEKPTAVPKSEEVAPFLNFGTLENASEVYARSAQRYDKALAKVNANGGTALASASLQQLNQLLLRSERSFLSKDGLPERPWFKHQIYAPGAYTGYAVKTLPAVRESIEQNKWQQAEQGILTVSKVLTDEAQLVNQAAEQLENVGR